MKKKVILSTIISFVLLFAVVAAGLNAIFTVTVVQSDFSVYSDDARAETEELKKKLDKFVGKSSTFLDLKDVEKTVEEVPAFCVTQIKKKYPEALVVSVRERKETYAFAVNGGYALLDEEGYYLYEKEENINRLDKKENILLEGFDFTVSDREFVKGEYAEALFQMFGVFEAALTEIRANVTAASFIKASSSIAYFQIRMREGVVINLYAPAQMTSEKAQAAVEKYLSLTDSQRVEGTISVVDTDKGLNVDYRA